MLNLPNHYTSRNTTAHFPNNAAPINTSVPEGMVYQETGTWLIEKPRLSLVPPTAMAGMARAMSYGASQAHSFEDWLRNPRPVTEYLDKALRHLLAIRAGEFIDQDSGLDHFSHAMADLAIIRHLWLEDSSVDDTPMDGLPYNATE